MQSLPHQLKKQSKMQKMVWYLVVPTTDKEYMPAIEKAAAVIVEEGGLTSHAAVVGIAKDIPVIVGA
jgi:phosphohistidine swiveling domain-containing protein